MFFSLICLHSYWCAMKRACIHFTYPFVCYMEKYFSVVLWMKEKGDIHLYKRLTSSNHTLSFSLYILSMLMMMMKFITRSRKTGGNWDEQREKNWWKWPHFQSKSYGYNVVSLFHVKTISLIDFIFFFPFAHLIGSSVFM